MSDTNKSAQRTGYAAITGNIDVIRGAETRAAWPKRDAQHDAAIVAATERYEADIIRIKADKAALRAERAEDVANRLKYNLPPLDGPVASTEPTLEDWLRAFGPYRDRPNEKESAPEWDRRRRKEAKVKFPRETITQSLVREIGRELGKGYAV